MVNLLYKDSKKYIDSENSHKINVESLDLNINSRVFISTMFAVFTAVAIVLSIFENFIPQFPFMPLGAKIGLSNIVNMACSGCIGILPALAIAVLKSFFVGLTRGFIAFVMSLLGGIVSTLITGICLRAKKVFFGYIGIGVLGALSHNLVQLAVAYVLTKAPVYYYLPFIIIASVVCGSITGYMLKIILPTVYKVRIKFSE